LPKNNQDGDKIKPINISIVTDEIPLNNTELKASENLDISMKKSNF